MIALHFRLAWRSLRRSPWFSAVMVLTLGLALSNWYMKSQVFRALLEMPAHGRSLRALELTRRIDVPDMRGLRYSFAGRMPSVLLTWRDAQAALGARGDATMTATFDASLTVEAGGDFAPVRARFATPELFSLFEIPFEAGTAWASDASHDVVISHALATRLFGAAPALGARLSVRGVPLRVVGVTGGELDRHARVYDLLSYMSREDLYLPLALAEPLAAQPTLAFRAGPHPGGSAGLAASEDGWLSVWARFPDVAAERAFLTHMERWLEGERVQGRAEVPEGARLHPAATWRYEVMRPEGAMEAWPTVAALTVLTCACNLVRLLMAKFGRRGLDLGLMRTFGARRRTLFFQLLLEGALIGLAAGVLGVILGVLTAVPMRTTFFVHVDLFAPVTALETLALALFITLAASAYPAWRLSLPAPAAHLRRA
jgi:putative ABC transport system permease protein